MDDILLRLRSKLTINDEFDNLVANKYIATLQTPKWSNLFKYLYDREQIIADREIEEQRLENERQIRIYKEDKFRNLALRWKAFIEDNYDLDQRMVDFIKKLYSKKEQGQFNIGGRNNTFWCFNIQVKKYYDANNNPDNVELIFSRMKMDNMFWIEECALTLTMRRMYDIASIYFLKLLKLYYQQRYGFKKVLYTIENLGYYDMSYCTSTWTNKLEYYHIVSGMHDFQGFIDIDNLTYSSDLTKFLDNLVNHDYITQLYNELGINDDFLIMELDLRKTNNSLRAKMDEKGSLVYRHPKIDFTDLNNGAQEE